MAKWWTYQRERFPVVGHGLPVAAFAVSAVCYSRLLRSEGGWPHWGSAAVAFVTAFLFFLQLRIVDEFKDFDEDLRHRPYRPVPRGLVTLRELAWVGVGAAAVQLLLAAWLAPSLLTLLAVVWLYLGLIGKEFFARGWLRRRPVATILSHMLFIPLVDLYATACDWLTALPFPPAGLGWFVAASYFNGIGIEIGRKVRSPADEEAGVLTYSSQWGRRTAVAVWLGALAVAGACAVAAMSVIGFPVVGVVGLGILFVVAAVVAIAFQRNPALRGGKRVERMAAVWTVGLYLVVGVVPLACRLFSDRG